MPKQFWQVTAVFVILIGFAVLAFLDDFMKLVLAVSPEYIYITLSGFSISK
ncbi:hypothetical protein RhiirC2_796626 [Rhizophagus irregularis]|uniref:Uncharacterized protein n=1 Tax=Rhizophagus irregularis TaxID=588596 RepID=A0A2N1M9C5_9GLOM|nr:hypothetical protein RhiirC2_796626 [Rhizophagus irregularis]